MSSLFIYCIATVTQFVIALLMAIICSRLFVGPLSLDRASELKGLGACAILMGLIIAIKSGQPYDLPAILVFGFVYFVATVMISKLVIRGENH